MLKTIIVLPNGREISSGPDAVEAVQSLRFTETVNDDRELSPGSVCSNMVEVRLITPGGSLEVRAGDEITVYREDERGLRHKLGLFTTEKPTRPSANILSITAFDRVSRLDQDLTAWLAGLEGWPYNLLDFARMVCDACGVTLTNDSIPNGDYPVQPFSADGITGRQLMRWAGQIAGRFCRATVDGALEFAWYEPLAGLAIAPQAEEAAGAVTFRDGTLTVTGGVTATYEDGGKLTLAGVSAVYDGAGGMTLTVGGDESLCYYQGGLRFEDYTVQPIEKVQLRQNDRDVGTVYPDTAEDLNTYTVTGNYLLTANVAESLAPVAENLYHQLKDAVYTPCRVEIPADLRIRAGHILSVTDANGRSVSMYVMTRTQKGQRDILECTGSPSRGSSAAVNNQTFRAFTGKMLNLRTDVEGLQAEHKNAVGDLARLQLQLDGISTEVSRQQQTGENWKQTMTQLRQDSEKITLQVQKIEDTGTGKLKTGKGYTFDDDGLRISQEGGGIENRLDHTGMYVTRAGQTLLKANNDGVEAVDITVRNYLKVGSHARFEDYISEADSDRTACFFT